MKATFLLTSLTFLGVTFSFSQNTFSGKVIDAFSRQPLEDVSIWGYGIDSTQLVSVTDQNGYFILNSQLNNKQLTTNLVGYKTKSFQFNSSYPTLIVLEPSNIQLKDIIVNTKSTVPFNNISKVDVTLKPVRNTQELLRMIPGLFIAQHAGGGKAEQIFLRGFDCDHGTDIQLSVDGIPINMVSHAHGQGYADAHFIIPETINTIDFAAGPYYANHGNMNTGGYVQFSTYKNIPKSLFQVEAGNFNTFRNLFMIDLLKKNKDKESAFVAVDVNYTDGPTINKQFFNRINVFGKYNLYISNSTDLSISISGFKSKWNASGQLPERAVVDRSVERFGSLDPSEGGNTERYNANIQLLRHLQDGASWTNQLFYTKYAFNLYSNFSFYLKNPVTGDEIKQAETRNVFGINSQHKKTKYYNAVSLTSTFGGGFRIDDIRNSELSSVEKRVFIAYKQLGDIKELNAFAYTQQQVTVGKLLLEAGMRIDYFNFNYADHLNVSNQPGQQKAIISPKFIAQYTFNPTIQLYSKLGKGFHSNDTRVVVANSGTSVLPAAYGADLGVILKPNKNIYLDIALWSLYLEQEFVYVGDEGIVEPSGETLRKGIDLNVRLQLSKRLFANLSINYSKGKALKEEKGNNYIPLAPELSSTGGMTYKTAKGFSSNLSYRFIKNRSANNDYSIEAKGYFLVDMAFNYTQKKYALGLSIENCFNVKWNEAQFATESRVFNEPNSVTELHFTPGSPLFAKLKFTLFIK